MLALILFIMPPAGGAADGTRTRTVFLPVNFKSTMSTDSITAAYENCKFQTGENSGEN